MNAIDGAGVYSAGGSPKMEFFVCEIDRQRAPVTYPGIHPLGTLEIRGIVRVKPVSLVDKYGFSKHRCSETHAPVAQLDRVPGFEPGGREFESLRARHFKWIVCRCYLAVNARFFLVTYKNLPNLW